MAKVSITQKDSILDQLEHIRHRIAQRAYDLFLQRNGVSDDAVADWLTAEREILWRPQVELREEDGVFTVLAALAGVEPKDVSVDVTDRDAVIKAEAARTSSKTQRRVHQSEFAAGRLFRSVHFPRPVDPGKARAEYRNGLLTLTVPCAPEAAAKSAKTKT